MWICDTLGIFGPQFECAQIASTFPHSFLEYSSRIWGIKRYRTAEKYIQLAFSSQRLCSSHSAWVARHQSVELTKIREQSLKYCCKFILNVVGTRCIRTNLRRTDVIYYHWHNSFKVFSFRLYGSFFSVLSIVVIAFHSVVLFSFFGSVLSALISSTCNSHQTLPLSLNHWMTWNFENDFWSAVRRWKPMLCALPAKLSIIALELQYRFPCQYISRSIGKEASTVDRIYYIHDCRVHIRSGIYLPPCSTRTFAATSTAIVSIITIIIIQSFVHIEGNSAAGARNFFVPESIICIHNEYDLFFLQKRIRHCFAYLSFSRFTHSIWDYDLFPGARILSSKREAPFLFLPIREVLVFFLYFFSCPPHACLALALSSQHLAGSSSQRSMNSSNAKRPVKGAIFPAHIKHTRTHKSSRNARPSADS